MIKKNNVPLSDISWLSTLPSEGMVDSFFEPETSEELISLCSSFYKEGLDFDLIGHTSNTLYIHDYRCERMVSTRKLKKFVIGEDVIKCQCGTSVRQLALAAINAGICGFEGLIDLPGTVASAIYGHATCYNCDISSLLINATVLTDDGNLLVVTPEWFYFKQRSSILKRNEKKAVIVSVVLKRINGDSVELKSIADNNHATRQSTQPEAKNSLGSIFCEEGRPSVLNRFLGLITLFYGALLRLTNHKQEVIAEKRNHLKFVLLGAKDVEPYVRRWNWYQWRDENSHKLFWKYVHLHNKLFTKSEFEIEIKQNRRAISK